MAWDSSRDVEYKVQSLREMIHVRIEELNGYIAQYKEIES